MTNPEYWMNYGVLGVACFVMGFAIYSTVQFFKPLIKEGFELFKEHLRSMNMSMATMSHVLEQIGKRMEQIEDSLEVMIGRNNSHRKDNDD